MGCNNFLTEQTDKLIEASMRGENSGFSQEALESVRDEVERAIEERIEKMAEERVNKHIERGGKEVPVGGVTPEKVESLFTKEYNEWREEVRSRIPVYQYCQIERVEEKGKVMASLIVDPASDRAGIVVYAQTLREAQRNITHEFVEMDYELMPQDEKERFEKEIWPTTDKEKERDFFNQWGKGYGEYAISDHRQNYCFWMTAFKHDTARLKELKEINAAKFNFCKERYKMNEIKVIKEQIESGGLFHFS